MKADGLELGPVLIKSEPHTKITIEGDLVRKVYVTPAGLTWRTFLRPSKAKREFENLAEMRARGIGAVEPVAYRDSRRLGVSLESEICTKLVPNAMNFRDMIRGATGDASRNALAQLHTAARLVGASLRRMHERGIMFASASPRNWIFDMGRFPAEGSCMACDPSYTAFSSQSLTGTARASVDVYTLVFSHGRRTTLSAATRLRILHGYTGGDRAEARRLWRRLVRRRTSVHEGLRTLMTVFGMGTRMIRGRSAR